MDLVEYEFRRRGHPDHQQHMRDREDQQRRQHGTSDGQHALRHRLVGAVVIVAARSR
ncbi:hypothetical protein ACVIJ6_000319 [Bradyrhizobium sp. USDA 4369]